VNNETIIYLLRKTSLTRTEIGKLTLDQYTTLLKEVYYQESVEEYWQNYKWAAIMALLKTLVGIYTKHPKNYQVKDFLKGEAPTRNKPQNELEELASKHNVKLPTKEIKNRGE